MIDQSITVKGVVTIKVFDKKKNLIDTIVNNNLVVTSGLQFFVDKIIGDATDTDISKIGVGAGNRAASMSDTDLESVTRHVQAVDSVTRDTPNRFLAEVTIGDDYGGNTVSELALFATDTYGTDTLIARTVLGATQEFTKTNGNDIVVFWEITLG
jgi:hypothetical protein